VKVFRQLSMPLVFVILSAAGVVFAQEAPQPKSESAIESLAKTISDQKKEIDALRQEVAAIRRYVGDPSQIAGTATSAGIARDLGGAAQLFDRRDHNFKDRLIVLEEWQVAAQGAVSPLARVPGMKDQKKRQEAQMERYGAIRYLQGVVRKIDTGPEMQALDPEARQRMKAEIYGQIAHLFGEIQKMEYDAVERE